MAKAINHELMQGEYGWAENGNVYCAFCAYTQAAPTLELAEHRIKTHLREAHGKSCLVRVENDTGRAHIIP